MLGGHIQTSQRSSNIHCNSQWPSGIRVGYVKGSAEGISGKYGEGRSIAGLFEDVFDDWDPRVIHVIILESSFQKDVIPIGGW